MKWIKVDNGLARGTIASIRRQMRLISFSGFFLRRHMEIGLKGSPHGDWTEPTKFRWGAE